VVSGVKRLFSLSFALVAGLATVTPASSRDASRVAPPAVAIDWSGLYVGLHGGYGWSNVGTGLGNVHVDGWLGGGHVGLQRQFDRWVVGIEASYSAGELDGSRTIDLGGDPLRLDAAISDLILVTGRLGYAWDDRLLYIKAGYASADVEVGSTYLGVTTQAKSRLDGWTAGFGFERMLTANIAVGLEYNYIDLGSKNLAVAAAPVPTFAAMLATSEPPPKPTKPTKIDPDEIHTVFARLTFRFGSAPAPYVPYK
jgi:outer membrane immunogenic protein